jgi:hypothetical protein
MASSEYRVSPNLNGWFKEQYADKLEQAVPTKQFRVQKMVPFRKQMKPVGNKYHQPVMLQWPQGVTYANASSGAFALRPVSAGSTFDAQILASQMVVRDAIDYESISLAQSSKQAFGKVTSLVVDAMMNSLRKRLEVDFLYGQLGNATVASVASTVITVATAEWAAGIWAGSIGTAIDIWNAALTVFRGTCNITATSNSAKTITVDALPAGTVATDVIFYAGAKGNQMLGIHKVVQGGGTIFNIPTTNDLWQSPSTPAGSVALSFPIIQKEIGLLVEKGVENDLTLLANHKAWSNLMTTEASLREYDYSYNAAKAERGAEDILFHEQNGITKIIAHPYVKEGYSFLLTEDDWLRVGSTDISFDLPGNEGAFFRPLENNAGFELRAYSNQAGFCKMPGRSGLITAIVNS